MKATLIETDEGYDAFAPYYDALTAGSDYETWTAQVLELAARHGWRGRTSSEEVRAHRARLAQLDELAAELGWEARPASGRASPPSAPGSTPSPPRQLSAPAELLHDAFYGALIDAGERLAVTADRAWRGELPLERVQQAAAEVLALHRLLRLLESLTSE